MSRSNTSPAPPISPRARTLAQQLDERAPEVLLQLERCVQVLGEPTVDAVLAETEGIEQGTGMLTQDGTRRRTKGGVFLYLARSRCTPEQRAIVFPPTDWRAQHAKRNAARNATAKPARTAPPPAPPSPLPPVPPAAPAKRIYFFPGISTVKTTLKGRPIQATIADGYTRLLFERSDAKDSFPSGIPAAPSEPQRVTVYVGAKQWTKVAGELERPSVNLTIDGVMILENGKLVLRAQSVSTYEKPPKA